MSAMLGRFWQASAGVPVYGQTLGGVPFSADMAGHLCLPTCLSLFILGDCVPHQGQGLCLFSCISGTELRTFSAL